MLDQIQHPLVFLSVVDPDGLIVVVEQVAKQSADDARLAVEHGRRSRRFHLLADLRPDFVEGLEVADDVFLGTPRRGGTDDHPSGKSVRLAEFADDGAQPAALLAGVDLARDADVIHGRHEHQKPPRHGHVGREPGALGAQGLLDHLDDDLLPFAEEIFDLGLRDALGPGRRARPAVFVARLELVELFHRVDHVGDVEEPVALETDVDERGLHAGQDLRDPALVNVTDDSRCRSRSTNTSATGRLRE